MCRVLEVSATSYYAWLMRRASALAREDGTLATWIAEIHHLPRGTYGSPRIREELKAQGTPVSRKRVARLMR
jgi:transposase InsO family protein